MSARFLFDLVFRKRLRRLHPGTPPDRRGACIFAGLFLLVGFFVSPVIAFAQPDQPLEIRIGLSNKKALLGEPIWVEVTATNRTQQTLAINWLTACPVFGTTAIEIGVPNAVPVNTPRTPCGSLGGNCSTPGPTKLAVGESETRRYVLAGRFRIDRPGRYRVVVHKAVAWKPDSAKPEAALPMNYAAADFEGVLEIEPSDPGRLLSIEQYLAAQAARPIPVDIPPGKDSGLGPQSGPIDQEAYRAAVRNWSEANRKRTVIAAQYRREFYEGLATYPAAGMEPVFLSWDTEPLHSGYGITALKALNTPEARKALARLAEPVPERVINGVRQTNSRWVAIRALGGTGDLSYLSLVESYAKDSDPEVRRAAIFAMGELGGEQALSALDKIARQSNSRIERGDAIITLGRTQSAKAVPLLIALFDTQNAEDKSSANYALMTLTHHAIPASIPDDARMKSQWEAWWQANRKSAHIYDPYDCVTSYNH